MRLTLESVDSWGRLLSPTSKDIAQSMEGLSRTKGTGRRNSLLCFLPACLRWDIFSSPGTGISPIGVPGSWAFRLTLEHTSLAFLCPQLADARSRGFSASEVLWTRRSLWISTNTVHLTGSVSLERNWLIQTTIKTAPILCFLLHSSICTREKVYPVQEFQSETSPGKTLWPNEG